MPATMGKKIEFERKQRSNTGCLRGILYFIVICGVSLALALFGWNCINDVLALNKPDNEIDVTVPEGFTISELSRELAGLGVINQPWLFTLYCNYSKAEEKIEPGDYVISSRLDYNAIVKSFVIIPVREEVTVRVTEGKTLEETLRLIAEQGVSDYDSLLAAVDEAEFTFKFLDDLPYFPGRLEGYLYPDTYSFFSDSGPRTVIWRFLDNFDRKLTSLMREEIDRIDVDLNQILTIASMIQAEAANAGEYRDISAVIWNRLRNPRDFPYLQIDAAVIYGMDGRREITAADLDNADNPYNTYQHQGLPPGPICSPTRDAITAALYPPNTKNFFYALHKDGHHEFFTTKAAHGNFVNGPNFAGNN